MDSGALRVEAHDEGFRRAAALLGVLAILVREDLDPPGELAGTERLH